MGRALALLGGAVLVAALVALVALRAGGGAREEPGGLASGASGGGSEAGPALGAPPELPHARGVPTPAPVPAPGLAAPGADEPVRTPVGSARLEVRVELPSGLPDDEELEVLVVAAGGDGPPGRAARLRERLEERRPFERLFRAAVLRAGGVQRAALDRRRPLVAFERVPEAVVVVHGHYVHAALAYVEGETPEPLVLAPALGARVRGRVELADGSEEGALEGVRVLVEGSGDPVSRGGNATILQGVAPDGAFELFAVPGTGESAVRADAPGLLAAPAVIAPEPGERVELVLALRAGLEVRGVVTDAAGEPLVGCVVQTPPGPGWRQVETGPDGAYLLEGLPAGRTEVSVLAPGGPSRSFVVEGPAGAVLEHDVRFGPRGRIEGVVSDASGAPAAGAWVVFESRTGDSLCTRAGEHGTFVGPLLPEGSWDVRALRTAEADAVDADGRARGPVGGWSSPRTVEVRGSWTTDGVELALLPPARLEVRVVDTAGRDVANAQLFLSGPAGERSATTAGDGRATFEGLVGGAWRVRASAPGHGRESREVELGPGHPSELELVLPASAPVRGRVVGPGGEPVAGATVHARGVAGLATAAVDGSFELVVDRTTSVLATHPSLAPSSPLPVEPGQAGVTLRLSAPGAIAGRLVRHDGTPWPRRRVRLDETAPGEVPETWTDAAGEFAFEGLAPGRHMVFAPPAPGEGPQEWGEASATPFEEVVVLQGATTRVELTGFPPLRPVRLHGRLEGDRRVAGAELSFFSGRALSAEARADEDGSYAVELPSAGPWCLVVPAAGAFRRTFDVPPAADVRRDFRIASGGLRGRVLHAGEPLGDAVVIALATAGEDGLGLPGALRERTGADGGFRFEDLSAGEYDVVALAPGAPTLGRALAPGVRVGEGSEVELELEVGEAAPLGGTVLDEHGAPLAFASVWTFDGAGHRLSDEPFAHTDAAGRFAADDAGGLAVLWLALDDERVSRVVQGAGEELVLSAEPGAWLQVHMRRSGGPYPGRLSVRDSTGVELAALVAEEASMPVVRRALLGSRLVGPLPPGELRLRALFDDGGVAEETVRLAAGEAARVVLEAR